MTDRFVVGMGEALWDMLPEGKRIGGAPANFAYHISQFGLPGIVVSAVGDDLLGSEIIETFSSKGLNQLIEVTPYPTGTVMVELDQVGVPRYDIRENVAWDNIPFTPELEVLARNTGAVCFGSLAQRSEVSRTTINRFLDAIPAANNPLIVFDINLRQNFYTKEILAASMKRCNILKINDEELFIVSRMFGISGSDLREMCRHIMDLFSTATLILTCGVNGSYVFTGAEESYLPTPRVQVADTVGAGDSFTAAFTAALLKGRSIAEAHALAVETSAYICSCHGAMPLLPDTLTQAADNPDQPD